MRNSTKTESTSWELEQRRWMEKGRPRLPTFIIQRGQLVTLIWVFTIGLGSQWCEWTHGIVGDY